MSQQHAQQVIAELYDYDANYWGTPESGYARHWYEHRCEGRSKPTGKAYSSLSPQRKEQLRKRIDTALAR